MFDCWSNVVPKTSGQEMKRNGKDLYVGLITDLFLFWLDRIECLAVGQTSFPKHSKVFLTYHPQKITSNTVCNLNWESSFLLNWLARITIIYIRAMTGKPFTLLRSVFPSAQFLCPYLLERTTITEKVSYTSPFTFLLM